MNQSYELVFEGVKDPNPQTVQRVKAVLIGDLNLTIDQVKNLLSGEQTLILESQDSMLLSVPYELLKKSGAKVTIVEKGAADIGTVDVSLSTLALDDNYSEPLFPKVVQPERLIAAEIDDGFGDLSIDTSIQHSEPLPAHPAKAESGHYEFTIQAEEQPPLPSAATQKTCPPPPLPIMKATETTTFSFSIEGAPTEVVSPAEKAAIKEKKKSYGALPIFLAGIALLIVGNIIYKNVTDTTSSNEAIIGQSIQAALKPAGAPAKTDKKTKKDTLAPSSTLFIPPTLFKQSNTAPDNKSFSASFSYSDDHLSGAIEFNDTTAYIPDIERIRARLAPLPIISKIYIELPAIPSDAIHNKFHWTGPAAISVTVGELKTRRVGSAELTGAIEGDKFVGVIATALNLDTVVGEPIDVHTTPEGQIVFRITSNVEALKDSSEEPVKENTNGVLSANMPLTDVKS